MCFPFVIPQALYVRKTTLRLPPASGPDSGVANPKTSESHAEPLRLLGIGDSIIAGVGCAKIDNALLGHFSAFLAEQHGRPVRWLVRARSGANTQEVIDEQLPIAGKQFDWVLISVGVNDITGLKRSNQWLKLIQELIEALYRMNPQAKFVIAPIPPMARFPALPIPLRWVLGWRSDTFDELVNRLAKESRISIHYTSLTGGVSAEEFARDGYHPNESACAKIALTIMPSVKPGT